MFITLILFYFYIINVSIQCIAIKFTSNTYLNESLLSWYTTNTTQLSTVNETFQLPFDTITNISLIDQLQNEYTKIMIEYDITDPQYVIDISALSDIPSIYCNNSQLQSLVTGASSTINSNNHIIPYYQRQFGLQPSCIIQVNFMRMQILPNVVPVNTPILRNLNFVQSPCSQYTNCSSCLNKNFDGVLFCSWCPASNVCINDNNLKCSKRLLMRPYECNIDYNAYSYYYPFLSGTAISSNPSNNFLMGTKPCIGNSTDSIINNTTNNPLNITQSNLCSYVNTTSNIIMHRDLLRRSGAAVLVHHARQGKSALCMIGGIYKDPPSFFSIDGATDSVLCSFNGIDWYEQISLPLLCTTPIAISHQGTLFVTGCVNSNANRTLNTSIWYAHIIPIQNNSDYWTISEWKLISYIPITDQLNMFENNVFLGLSQYIYNHDIPLNPKLIIGTSKATLDGIFNRKWYIGDIFYNSSDVADNNQTIGGINWSIVHVDYNIDSSELQWKGIGTLQYLRDCSVEIQNNSNFYCYGNTQDEPLSNLTIKLPSLSSFQRLLLFDRSTIFQLNASVPITKEPMKSRFYGDSIHYAIPQISQNSNWPIVSKLPYSSMLNKIILRNRFILWPDMNNEPSIIYYRTKEIHTGYFTPCQACKNNNDTNRNTTWYGCEYNPFEPVCRCTECQPNEYIEKSCSEYSDTICKSCTICKNNEIISKSCNSTALTNGNTVCMLPSTELESYLNMVSGPIKQSMFMISFIIIFVGFLLVLCSYIGFRISIINKRNQLSISSNTINDNTKTNIVKNNNLAISSNQSDGANNGTPGRRWIAFVKLSIDIILNDKTILILFTILFTIFQIYCTISWLLLIPWACILPINDDTNTISGSINIIGNSATCASKFVSIVLLIISFLIGTIYTPLLLRYYRDHGYSKIFAYIYNRYPIWFTSIILINILSLRNIYVWTHIHSLRDLPIVHILFSKHRKEAHQDSSKLNMQTTNEEPDSLDAVTLSSSVSSPVSSLSTTVNTTTAIPNISLFDTFLSLLSSISTTKISTKFIMFITSCVLCFDCIHLLCIGLVFTHSFVYQSYNFLSILLLIDGLLTIMWWVPRLFTYGITGWNKHRNTITTMSNNSTVSPYYLSTIDDNTVNIVSTISPSLSASRFPVGLVIENVNSNGSVQQDIVESQTNILYTNRLPSTNTLSAIGSVNNNAETNNLININDWKLGQSDPE